MPAAPRLRPKSRLARLLEGHPPRRAGAAFTFVNGFVTIAVLSAVASLSGTPFIFPSLGPTAFLFFHAPLSASASPRHAILGHAIGILCGYGALLATGLQDAPPALLTGVGDPRILAAALSLGGTAALMILLGVPHAPACATTLIVSLGIIRAPRDLLIIEAAVVALAAQAIVVNRLAGLPYPLWAPREKTDRAD